MTDKDIQILLSDSLPNSQVIVHGEDGTHFDAVVVSDLFLDKKSLERQKIVYAIVGQYISSGAIHALSLKTFTQQEWQDKCGN